MRERIENRAENVLSLAKTTFPKRLLEKTLENCPRTVPRLPGEASWGPIGALLGALGVLLERFWTFLGETLAAQNGKSWLKAGSESGFFEIQSAILLSAREFDPPGVDFGPPRAARDGFYALFCLTFGVQRRVLSLPKVCPKFVQNLFNVGLTMANHRLINVVIPRFVCRAAVSAQRSK